MVATCKKNEIHIQREKAYCALMVVNINRNATDIKKQPKQLQLAVQKWFCKW